MDDLTRELSKSSFFPVGQQPMAAETLSRAVAPSDTVNLLNEVVDSKYKILRVIGSGGMGSVYLAKHLMLDKNVALKTFRSYNLSQDAKLRFQREAQAIAKLSNPNIVQVFDFGYVNEQVPYYTMEILNGQSLGEKLEDCQFLEIDEAVHVFVEVCRGLQAAHKKGIVHRDLKPDNIFLESKSESGKFSNVKIVDFGIAALATPNPESQKLTAIGTIFGSPLYMSPEQAMGKEVTACSDIYSCGCALFQTLTGKPPYLGPNAFATMLMHQNASIPRLTTELDGRECPPALEQLVTKMLTKAPEERYQSADEVLENLLSLQQISQMSQTRSSSQQIPKRQLSKASSTDYQSETDESDAVQDGNLKLQLVAGFTTVLLLLAAGYWYFDYQNNHRPEQQEKLSAPTRDVIYLSPKSALEPDEADLPLISSIELRRAIASANNDNRLTISQKKIPAQAIELIANTKAIHQILVKSCIFDNKDLFKLAKLNLLLIHLNSSTFNDVGAAALAQSTQLQEINASGTNLSDDGLKELIKLKNLTALSIGGTRITTAGLAELQKCTKLKFLGLASTNKLGHDEIVCVSKINCLNAINLNQTKVSVELLRTLCKNANNCKYIEVKDCPNIGPQAVKQLHLEFPSISFNCQAGT